MNSAKDSFSHRSSHQRMVTRSPEPHVCHLVQDRVGAGVADRVGDLAAEDEVVLVERDAARVLHRSGVELGHAQLVVLGERVGPAELALEELEALLGDLEDLAGVEV